MPTTLLIFSLAQLGGTATALLALGANVRFARSVGFARWLGHDLRTWRNARRACWLAALPWEQLLALPLETVRQLTRVSAPERANVDTQRESDAAQPAEEPV